MSLLSIEESKVSCRNQVIRGDYTQDILLWKPPKFKLLVYVSSTFTDTHQERNILIEKIQPLLHSYGLPNEVSVTFIDMSYGIKDQNTLNHNSSWDICSKELERCRNDSAGLYFLSLLSDKYGFMPLPSTISKTLLDECMKQHFESQALAQTSEETNEIEKEKEKEEDLHIQSLVDEWFILDHNSIPLTYQLKHSNDINDTNYWNNVLPKLRHLLRNISFDLFNEELKIDRSVTEWEIKSGLCNDLMINRVYWIHRIFKKEITIKEDSKQLLNDCYNNSSQLMKLNNLKIFMKSMLLTNNRIKEYIFLIQNNKSEYLINYEINTTNFFINELNSIIDLKNSWILNGCGLNFMNNNELLNEILLHNTISNQKCKLFHERSDLINNCLHIIDNINNDEINTITFAIVGFSGLF